MTARLRQSPLFAGLRDDQVSELLALAQDQTFLAGELLLAAGDTAGDLLVLIEGEANGISADGDVILRYAPGSVAGIVSFLDGRPQPLDVVARGKVDAVRLPARETRALMNRDRDLGFTLMGTMSRVVCHRYRVAISRIDDLLDEVGDAWDNSL
jgi:CRP-like cAMP-binding protein